MEYAGQKGRNGTGSLIPISVRALQIGRLEGRLMAYETQGMDYEADQTREKLTLARDAFDAAYEGAGFGDS